MVELFLSEPTWSDAGYDESIKQRISLLSNLESTLWSLLTSGGRAEARLWLCKTLSSINSVTRHDKLELFLKLFRSKPLKRGVAGQLLQMIFEKEPDKAGPVIANKSYVLDKFFKGNPRRILQWFSNFSGSGDVGHRQGAKALSQFAFVNRDICWEELEWKGKHGQSPAMVATKPHYFLDLDVQRTVENFLENVPEFWSSNEFADSLRDGQIFFVDTKFFVDFFVDLMEKEGCKEVWDIINEFLLEESFSSLCHHLLIILDERDLCVFLGATRKFLHPKVESMDFTNSSCWLEVILSMCSDFDSIDQLFLLNALISQGRQLLRLVLEEEDQEVKAKIQGIVLQLCSSSSKSNILAPIIEKCFRRRNISSIKWLGLQSWALHYRLSEECRSSESWESIFICNGINFRMSQKDELLDQNRFSDEWGSDLNKRAVRDGNKKKEKQRKKRRRDFDRDDGYNDELLDFGISSDNLSLQSSSRSWLLSTDDYSTSWSIMDLPEHLSKHCFFKWMKWVFVKWTDEYIIGRD